MEIDKLLIFDITGSMAHFRKFYTNSSSLSYAFPPRTTIIGLIAGILGKPRDSYYEGFSSSHCRVAISMRSPVRKVMQTVNYIRTKDTKEVTGSGGHTQIPLEFLFPVSPYEELRYRIYFWHKDEETLFNKLRTLLEQNTFVYPPFLGITECPGKIHYIEVCEGENFKILENASEEVKEIATVIPIDQIIPNGLVLTDGYTFMKEDRMPLEFNSKRYLKKISAYLYEKNCKPVKISVQGPVFKVKYKENGTNNTEFGVFME